MRALFNSAFFISLQVVISINSYCQQQYLQPNSVADLKEFLHFTPDRIPLISAHRGGPAPGFPENCLAAFENTLNKIPAFIECDVQLSKDSVLVMMHDDKLDRTSNGTGKVQDKTWKELKNLLLKDNDGDITSYTIPILQDVLLWAKGKILI